MDYMDDDDGSSSLSIPNESIDFDLVYALHSFAATVEGQANVVKGDSLFLMDDSNSYWWLVRVLKTQEVGYIPAENIETPFERLARLNKHRNVDVRSHASSLTAENLYMPYSSRPQLRPSFRNHAINSIPPARERDRKRDTHHPLLRARVPPGPNNREESGSSPALASTGMRRRFGTRKRRKRRTLSGTTRTTRTRTRSSRRSGTTTNAPSPAARRLPSAWSPTTA